MSAIKKGKGTGDSLNRTRWMILRIVWMAGGENCDIILKTLVHGTMDIEMKVT